MKYSILIALLLPFSVNADMGFRTCAKWDASCKSPPQIVATKCRLGVPVKKSTCDSLGYGNPTGLGAEVAGLPYSEIESGKTTDEILAKYL